MIAWAYWKEGDQCKIKRYKFCPSVQDIADSFVLDGKYPDIVLLYATTGDDSGESLNCYSLGIDYHDPKSKAIDFITRFGRWQSQTERSDVVNFAKQFIRFAQNELPGLLESFSPGE